MVRQPAALIILEILGGLILVVLLLAALLVFRLSSGPIELEMFRDDIERGLSNSRNGRPVTVDDVYLEWSAEDRRVLVTGYDIRLLDDQGNVSAEADSARIVLAGSALVLGDVEVLGLDLRDGWIDVRQSTDGIWHIAGDPLPEIPVGQMPQNPSEWLERINTVLPMVLTALGEAQQDFSLERLSFDQFEMRVVGADGAQMFKLADSRGALLSEEDGLSLAISGSGVGTGLPGGIAIDVQTSGMNARMNASVAVAEWSLADLAARLGAESETLAGVPADITLEFDTSSLNGVEEIKLLATLEGGELPFGDDGLEVSDLDLEVAYLATEDELRIDWVSSKFGPVSGELNVTVSDALKSVGDRAFTLASDRLTLDITPTLAAPVSLGDLNMLGVADFTGRAFKNTKLSFNTNDTRFNFLLDVALLADREGMEPPFVGTIELETEGSVAKESVLAFWPVTLGTGARSFTDKRITNTDVTNLEAQLTLKRDSFEQGYLRDEDLNLTFDINSANVKFLDDLPAAENAVGTGRLTGNSFRVIVDRADYGGWNVDEGLVDFPAFNPKGEDFRVFARGHGPADLVIKTLNESRLELDFEQSRVSGKAEATFELFRPALDNVPDEDVRYTAIGTLSDGGLKGAALGLDLSKATAEIKVDQEGMTISGFGDLGPAPVQFTWRDGFTDGDAPSALSATAIVSPDVLNRFGLPGRAYLSGEVPAEIQATIDGEEVSVANVAMDLTEARLDLSEIGWVKRAGQDGKVSVHYEREGDGFSSDVLFRSDDAYLDGQFTLGPDSRLVSADLRRAYLADTADVNGQITRDENDNLEVALVGSYLDLSGALPGIGALGSANESNGTPLNVTADVDTLAMGGGLFVRNADVTWNSTVNGMQKLSATGNTDDGSAFDIDLDGSSPEGTKIRVISSDAGFIASAFLDLDFLESGRLDLQGTLARDGSPSQFDIVITDGRLRNAPFLTQILSLASLRGLADTLGGDGVLFSRIDIPLTVAGDRYVVTGGKAQGPALGLTVNGYLNADSDISVDGVLVPSFGMNSALGGIPIIGDLVVGRDGEGVFSLTYSVRGSLEKANVSVNPLSALAPGVIRRIFENPADTEIPEAQSRPDDEPIPSELPPIPEEEF